MDDRVIVEHYWQRSEQALAETAAEYGAYCYSIAMRILQSKNDAEECVNDTYLRVWQSIPPQRPQNFKAYLGRITRNLALNRFQKITAQKRGGSEISLLLDELEECVSTQDTSSLEDQAAFSDLINRFLAELSVEARRMFVQRYWYGYSIREIARAHNVRTDSVASQLFRTRKNLAQYLHEKGEFI